jgi:hypothetical protein
MSSLSCQTPKLQEQHAHCRALSFKQHQLLSLFVAAAHQAESADNLLFGALAVYEPKWVQPAQHTACTVQDICRR